MNDLTPTQSLQPATPTTPALGRDLSELLDTTGSHDEAASRIANTPALLAEAREALPALKAVAETKAGQDGVRRVLSKRFTMYPQPSRTDEEWQDWFADYYHVLADVSLASLEAGMRAWVADPDSEFMPKPGKLRELAFSTPSRSLQRYYRAKSAVALADTPQPRLGPPPEDAAKVREMLADFQVKTIPSETKRPTMPSTAGKPDEGGLTDRMRELLARQREGR